MVLQGYKAFEMASQSTRVRPETEMIVVNGKRQLLNLLDSDEVDKPLVKSSDI